MNELETKTKIFCCYARKDKAFLKHFKKHISTLEKIYSIEIWYDRLIRPGEPWEEEIMQRLNEAHIILLFISVDLISSKYGFNTEVKRAVERYERGEAKVIAIILRDTRWNQIPVGGIKLGQLQALPNGAVPIRRSQNPDGSWMEVIDGIECVVKNLLGLDTSPVDGPENLGSVPDLPSAGVVSNGSSPSRLPIKLKGSLKNRPLFLARMIIALYMLLVLASLSPFRVNSLHSPLCSSNDERSPLSQSGDAKYSSNPFVNKPGTKEIMIDACGNVIGLSAGATILDTYTQEIDEMKKGAEALRNDSPAGALAHFQTVNLIDPSNAEAWIYRENLQLLNRNRDYIAVVLGLDMTPKNIGSSRESMRGAYLAQKAYNESARQRNSPSLVLILANCGAVYANATWVAQQIIKLNQFNHHIVGVVGWSGSVNSENANQVLAPENIFMLAPSASSSSLIGYPGFLRIIPSDIEQGGYLANYAYDKLRYRKIAIIYNSSEGNSGGINMHTSFEKAFTNKGGKIVGHGESYDPSDGSSLGTALSNALQYHPDGIGFFGLPADAGPLLSLPQIAYLPPEFKILTGSAVASVSDFPADQPNLERLVISAFASEDEWQFLHVEQPSLVAAFVKDYEKDTFKVGVIGTKAMLNYDAVNVFLQGYQKAFANGATSTCPPSCALQQALQSMNGEEAWQGISGQVAFKSGSTDPVDKVILIVKIEENKATGTRTTKTIAYHGCFLKNRTDCKLEK